MPMGAAWMTEQVAVSTQISRVYRTSNAFYTQLGARVYLFEYLYIGGNVKTTIRHPKYAFSFEPWGLFYDFEAGVDISYFNLFFRHYCSHPQVAYYFTKKSRHIWEGSYEEFGIRISGDVGAIKKRR